MSLNTEHKEFLRKISKEQSSFAQDQKEIVVISHKWGRSIGKFDNHRSY